MHTPLHDDLGLGHAVLELLVRQHDGAVEQELVLRGDVFAEDAGVLDTRPPPDLRVPAHDRRANVRVALDLHATPSAVRWHRTQRPPVQAAAPAAADHVGCQARARTVPAAACCHAVLRAGWVSRGAVRHSHAALSVLINVSGCALRCCMTRMQSDSVCSGVVGEAEPLMPPVQHFLYCSF